MKIARPRSQKPDTQVIRDTLKGEWFETGFHEDELKQVELLVPDELYIDADIQWDDLYSQWELEDKMYRVMWSVYRVATKFPQLKIIVMHVVPMEKHRDEYGHAVEESAFPFYLWIPCDDLRKFSSDVFTLSAGVYIANRYTHAMSGAVQKLWNRSFEEQRRRW